MRTRILVADHCNLFRSSLKAVLEENGLVVIGEASDGLEAVQKARLLRPDIALIEPFLPLLNGLDLARRLRADLLVTQVIFVTECPSIGHVTESLQGGVCGYVCKRAKASTLISAIKAVRHGAIYLDPATVGRVAGSSAAVPETPDDPLSLREREVVQLIAEGKTNKEVAALLGRSQKTVELQRYHAMKKLHLTELAQLVRYAVRSGMVAVQPAYHAKSDWG